MDVTFARKQDGSLPLMAQTPRGLMNCSRRVWRVRSQPCSIAAAAVVAAADFAVVVDLSDCDREPSP